LLTMGPSKASIVEAPEPFQFSAQTLIFR
jgi:hypothetical protein